MELALVPEAEIAEEVCLPFAVGEELRVELAGVEAGHGSAVEAEGAGGEDEVRTLEGAVAKGGFFRGFLVAGEVLAHVRVRKEARKVVVELRVPGNDHGDRSGHAFVDVARGENRLKAGFGFGSGDENETGGRGVGAGGSETGQSVGMTEERGGDGNGQPC